ncbi:MAG: hypothetical protein RLZZ239_120, partial [Pseudomonadota bacterium]
MPVNHAALFGKVYFHQATATG